MKGDFSRDSFDSRKHYSRVLMQMGRVLPDADWNAQADTVLPLLRALAAAIFGPHGGSGFKVLAKLNPNGPLEVSDLFISPGHYYVGGILCENNRGANIAQSLGATYYNQPHFPLPTQKLKDDFKIPNLTTKPFIVYLDVWERLVTSVEDPSIREVALGGPDTTTRTQVVWQVRLLELGPTDLNEVSCRNVQNTEVWQDNFVTPLQRRGRLRAKAQEARPADIGDPCNISPDARYRGAENQLYRVEIHHDGRAGGQADRRIDGQLDEQPGAATFKWSRDNGSVVFPVLGVAERTITLANLGRDSRLGLRTGDWVELVDDDYALRGEAQPLLQVEEVDSVGMKVILKTAPAATVGRDAARHPLLRRWDHREGDPRTGGLRLRDGAAVIVEQAGDAGGWLALEDGIQIKFEPGANYRTGDYWLIEARTATGDVVWPREGGQPVALPPHGVEHYYAPLANVYVSSASKAIEVLDLRHSFTQAACSDDPDCPFIHIDASENDGAYDFDAVVTGGPSALARAALTFHWEVSSGNIEGPENTRRIRFKPNGTNAVVVKVKVTPFPATCRNMATFILHPGVTANRIAPVTNEAERA